MQGLKIPVEFTGTKEGLRHFAEEVKGTNEELKKDYKDLSKQIMGKDVSRNIVSAQAQMNKLYKDANNVTAKMHELENTKVPTEWGKLSDELGVLSDKMEQLVKRQEQYEDMGKNPPQGFLNTMDKTSQRMTEVKQRMAELYEAGQGQATILGSETEEYAKQADKLDYINARMALQTEKVSELATKEGLLATETNNVTNAEENLANAEGDVNAVGTPLEQKMLKIAIAMSNLGQTAMTAAGDGLVWLVKNGINVAVKGSIQLVRWSGKLAVSLMKVGKNAVVAAKNLVKMSLVNLKDALKGGSKGVDDMGTAFKRGLTKVFAYGFGIRSLFRLFNKLRGYAKDALGSMSKQFDDVNRDLSAIVSAFSTLKNAIGTAVQPIIHALTPALVMLEKTLTSVLTKVGEFFAVLTGQKYIYKATDAQIDYAASLDDTTDSTDKNTKATKKNQQQLGYYDKLNVIGQDDNNNKNTTPSGDTGNGNVESGFVKADPSKAVSEFAKKVKEAWKKADFTEVGNILGTKLNDALKQIPWDKITTQAQRIGKSLGTLITGFVETDGLSTTIGSSLGNAVNAGIAGLTAFIDNTNFDSVATFITTGLNTAINTIKWEDLGSMLGKGANGIVTLISGFFNDTDWSALGSGIGKSIKKLLSEFDFKEFGSMVSGILLKWPKIIGGVVNEIDWDNAWANIKTAFGEFVEGFDFENFFGTLADVSGSIVAALANVISDIWDDITAYFDPFIEDAGGNIVLGVLNGIVSGIKGILGWIKTNVVDPFVNAFKKGFQIASPSKIMIKLGKFIMQGLINGIKSLWKALKTLVKNIPKLIKALFLDLPLWFGKLFLKALKLIKEAFTIKNIKAFFTLVLKGIKSVFNTVGSWFGKLFSGAWKKIKSAFTIENVKKFFSSVWKGITSVFSGVVGWFKNKFSEAWKKVKGVFSSGGAIFKGIKEGISKVFTSIVNKLIRGINKVIAIPFDKLNEKLNELRDWKVPVIKKKIFKKMWGENPLTVPKIPELAQGAVIPPNKEFMAILGDQKQGTNIETPLATMIEAFNTALAQNGHSSNNDIVVKINSKEIARAVWSENEKKYKQTGAFIPKYS